MVSLILWTFDEGYNDYIDFRCQMIGKGEICPICFMSMGSMPRASVMIATCILSGAQA